MTPEGVNIDSIKDQLTAGDVAFGTANPVNAQLGPAMSDALDGALAAAGAEHIEPVALVVLEQTPRQPADLRDLAQDLASETQFETVIVRTPHASGAVSERLSRYQIESAQRAMLEHSDYPEGVRAFVDTAVSTGWSWPLVAALFLLAAAAVVLGTAVTVLRSRTSAR
ncbi:DUF6676 family protein [Corynebacterium liangguodongii]|uniref:Uncharacterized protein n=1 Tax=Corynebacterium liangguodongii TaxID=2079535 RepID=A0A2S0WE35_9CORY|nr:DUF6676 family protein [Corynebacterium liangguodongii]AWB84029.1 hypothetical protein C3E79_05685 [Corynebacterium liangguodongii]PWC00041.1 hypothetical protein DF219_02325 [Corynebacterium liangguodongii]